VQTVTAANGPAITVVDASNRPRRRRSFSGGHFRGLSVYGPFALEVGARTIMASGGAGHFGGGAKLAYWPKLQGGRTAAPDDFSSCRLRCFLRAGSREAWTRTEPSPKASRATRGPVGRRAGQSGEARVGRASSDWLFRSERPRCSRAKPGKPTGRKISGGGATNVTDLAKLLWGRGRRRHIVGVFGKAAFGGWIYRRGMRGGGMVAGTRSWRGSRSCFEGRHVEVGAVSRGRSCFG